MLLHPLNSDAASLVIENSKCKSPEAGLCPANRGQVIRSVWPKRTKQGREKKKAGRYAGIGALNGV
jgi:hypothetical protein